MTLVRWRRFFLCALRNRFVQIRTHFSNILQISLPEKPLKGFADQDTFKVYYSDIGILNSLLDIKIKDICLKEIKF